MLTGLVGLHSRSYEPVTGSISIKTARLSGGAGVFFSRCSFDRPREHGRRTRPAYKTWLRTPQREDAAPKLPEGRRQFTRLEPSPEGVRETVRRCARQRGTNAKRVRCDDAPTRQHGTRRIQFARALASQRPPSRERPSLGGGGAGRAPSPSLCVSPFSRSIDDTEHGRRPVRGPPACSCWHITPGGGRRRRRRRPYAKNHICRRSRG